MNPDIQSLINRINELEAFVALKKQQQIAYPLDEVSKIVLSGKLAAISSSTKSATSENQAVNEGGAGTYNVLKAPDIFVQATINGTVYYLPAFT
jgi:hypothetical protein